MGDLTLEAIEQYRRGVPGAERILAAWYADQPLLDVGPLTEEEKANGYNVTNEGSRGTDTTYTLRILATWYADQPLLPEEQKEGRPPKGSQRSVDNINTSKGGTDTTYTLRRLARVQRLAVK